MHKGLREATQPSCITQHRATRSELLNFVSAEGYTPLHYVCDGRVAGRPAAAAVLELWQERASASVAPGRRSSGGGGGGAGSSGDPTALIGDPAGGGGGSGIVGVKTDESPPRPSEGSTDRVEILTWLLSEPEVDPKVRVPRGATTLHMAAALSGSEAGANLVRSLIHNGGVNLDALDSPASSGSGDRFWKTACSTQDSSPQAGDGGEKEMPPLRFSALHYALRARSWESANLLLTAGASVAPEGAFPPCLHVACLASAPTSLVERLLERERQLLRTAVLGDLAGPRGVTPLFLAASAGSADLTELLLSTRGTTGAPKLEDIAESETTLVMVGAGEDCGDPSARARGADDLGNVWIMDHSPSDGRCPLHAAAAGGHTNVARVLLDAELHDAAAESHDPLPRSWLNTPDRWGNTPLDMAVSEGHWECAETLAAAAPFDIRLAVERGPSSALVAVERANMAIVDEGRGDASTLSSLRESNKLVMTLLRRLHDAAVEASTPAEAAPHEGVDDSGPPNVSDLVDQAAESRSTQDRANQLENETHAPCEASSAHSAAPAPRSAPVPVVHHLHPCFAEGVLYSNAKGIFVPDTPERRRQRRESRLHTREPSGRDDQNRAAVIIQARARQAGARRAVAEKMRLGRAKQRRRSSVSMRRRSWSDATDQEKAAVLIQSQARQSRARAEMARIRDQRKQQQQQQRRSSKHRGEVGVVVVKAAG